MQLDNHEARRWKEFQESGFLWLVNRSLHIFGWTITMCTDTETGEVVSAYPARTPYRGFSEESEARGFKRVSAYMKKNATALEIEANE